MVQTNSFLKSPAQQRGDVARIIGEAEVKQLFAQRFHGCSCHKAFPDQLHTFVGDCSSEQQIVALVPMGDVRFPSGKIDGMCIIVVVAESVSADYLDFLEDMQISYVFAGADGRDEAIMRERLSHDFGIGETKPYAPAGSEML